MYLHTPPILNFKFSTRILLEDGNSPPPSPSYLNFPPFFAIPIFYPPPTIFVYFNISSSFFKLKISVFSCSQL